MPFKYLEPPCLKSVWPERRTLVPRLNAGIAGFSSVVLFCSVILAPAPASFSGEGSGPTDHRMAITMVPAAHALRVRDTVTFPTARDNGVTFLLHSQLHVSIETRDVILTTEETDVRPSSIDPTGRYMPKDARVPVTRYRVLLPPRTRILTLKYEGQINHPPVAAGDDYGRIRTFSALRWMSKAQMAFALSVKGSDENTHGTIIGTSSGTRTPRKMKSIWWAGSGSSTPAMREALRPMPSSEVRTRPSRRSI